MSSSIGVMLGSAVKSVPIAACCMTAIASPTITLPAGVEVASLPPAHEVDTGVIRAIVRWQSDPSSPSTLRLYRELTFKERRIEVEQVPLFAEAIRHHAAALAARVRLRPTTTASTGGQP